MNILTRLQLIKAFVFDMDGVLTDGSLIIDRDGQWLRRMNIKDGYALQLAIKKGYKVAVISGSEAALVAERLKKLGIIDVFMNIADKQSILEKYIIDNNLTNEEVLFMGDDIPDHACMKIAGFACCPSDAVGEIRRVSSYVSCMRGGYGCVRDVIEKVLKLNNHWPLETSVSSI